VPDDSTGGQTVPTTPSTVVWNLDTRKSGINDDNYFSLASDIITINKSGVFEISGNFMSTLSSGTRNHIDVRPQVNTGGGFVGVVEGSPTRAYHRLAGIHNSATIPAFIYPFSAGDQVRVVAYCGSSGGAITASTSTGGTSFLQIKQVL